LKYTVRIKKFAGGYISDDGIQISFRLSKNKLYADGYGQSFLLIEGEKDTFSLSVQPGVKLSFSCNAAGDTTVYAIFSPDENHLLKKYAATANQTDKLLQTYTGVYYSPELDCRYSIILKDHHLYLTNSKYKDTALTLAGTDHLTDDFWWMNHLMVIRNKMNQITGFVVNSGRIMHLRFDKIE
jgi:hypothetical protein